MNKETKRDMISMGLGYASIPLLVWVMYNDYVTMYRIIINIAFMWVFMLVGLWVVVRKAHIKIKEVYN